MPLRFYDNNDWRSPSEIRVRDNDNWNGVEVVYVYDLGQWKVVFPDAITPQVTLSAGPYRYTNSVYLEVETTNTDYIVAELYSGTTQSNLLQSQTIDTNNTIVDTKSITFSGLTGNTTYNIKITAYSITEDTAVLLTGSFTTAPTINVSVNSVNINYTIVSWTTSNQYSYRVIMTRTSDGYEVYRSGLNFIVGSTSSVGINVDLVANTQYTVRVEVIFDNAFGAYGSAQTTFTSPNVVQPTLTSFTSTSPSCSSMTVNWTGSNYVSGTVALWEISFDFFLGKWLWNSQEYYYDFNSSSLSSYTFTGLPAGAMYGKRLILTSSSGTSLDSDSLYSPSPIYVQEASAPNPPANFSAVSSYYGNDATLSWSHTDTNCAVRSGYEIQYRVSGSPSYLNVQTVSAGTTSYSMSGANITLLANASYDFRIRTKSDQGDSDWATTSVTTNNNPYKLAVFSSVSTTTFSTITVSAQLQNISGLNVSGSGRSVSFSATTGRGTFSSTSAITDSNGSAAVNYTTNETTGNITFTATSSGLQSGSWTTSVSLSAALNPSLSVTRTKFGYYVSNTNYNSLWTYSGSTTSPGFLFSGSYNSASFDIYSPAVNTVLPSFTQNTTSLTCDNGSWTRSPETTTTITSSRTGYSNGSGSVTSRPLVDSAGVEYTWKYYDANNNEQIWQTTSSATVTKNNFYNNNIKNRQIWCMVTAWRAYAGDPARYGANVANTLKAPAT